MNRKTDAQNCPKHTGILAKVRQYAGPLSIIMLVLMLLDLVGCSTTRPPKKAFAEEELLVAAGFTYKVADSAKKLEKLKSLPQRKLLRQARQGEAAYLYADVASCKCVYLGDEAAYQHLRRLAYDEKLTKKQEKGIWSTTRVDEVADFATFFDFDEFAGDPD